MNQKLELQGKDILIVDDTPDNLRVLSSILVARGCTVRKALSGKMALTICDKTLPDLILLDVMMPEMDGYETCRRLKARSESCNIPIIFISALNEVMDKVKAFEVGGADYITKPFQVEEVAARIAHQLTITQLTRELKRSNAELEQFASIVSHDLQSPLAGMVTLVELIQREYAGVLDEDGKNLLEEIAATGNRMSCLIQDLLAYSRINAKPLEFESIYCNRILEEVRANLFFDVSASGAKIVSGELPVVRGDRTLLLQLFQNLISNAIKFRRLEVTPEIEVAATVQEGQWLIAIRDNGIGIPPEKRDRIFEVFHRLHSSEEYPGHGIGLTTCQKIVRRHGGQIWIESQLGEGTTFFFTIPSTINN
jgi:signal transduction histidine kinase